MVRVSAAWLLYFSALAIYSFPAVAIWNEFFLSPDLDKLDQTGHARNRTAILITGQLRSGNISFASGNLKANANLAMFGAADPLSTIQTQIEWLMKPLTEWGGLDVFMYVDSRPDDKNYVWDGNPASFRPQRGDITACKPYSDNSIFHNGTGNRFFCLVEDEVALMNQFVRNFSTWSRYSYNSERMNEQALRQVYSMSRANLACKQFATAYGIHYTFKIRLRPDTAFVKPIGPLSNMLFRNPSVQCKKQIYYANTHIYHNGNEDWFNIGLSQDMDHLLDRYHDLTTEIFYGLKPGRNYFDLEDWLTQIMATKYGVCMGPHESIWMVVIRVNGHTLNTWQPPLLTNDWQELSTLQF
jgi:hypothetical protein